MTYRPGDIHWLTLPGPGGSGAAIPHPHVIVRREGDSARLCALTTNLHRASWPGNVLLEVGEGALPRQSVVAVSKVVSVPVAQLGAYIGSLAPERVAQIEAGMRFLERITERQSEGMEK